MISHLQHLIIYVFVLVSGIVNPVYSEDRENDDVHDQLPTNMNDFEIHRCSTANKRHKTSDGNNRVGDAIGHKWNDRVNEKDFLGLDNFQLRPKIESQGKNQFYKI